jgi:uncharacterized phiE125 gp8 family phage protein
VLEGHLLEVAGERLARTDAAFTDDCGNPGEALVGELALDEFPAAGILLLQGPVIGITSVSYVDATGATQTLSGSAYSLDDYSTPQWLLPAVDTEWPATYQAANAVKVRYVAGAATLDGAVAQALRLLTGLYFDNRNAADKGALTEIPFGVQALLDTVRIY